MYENLMLHIYITIKEKYLLLYLIKLLEYPYDVVHTYMEALQRYVSASA